MVWEREACCGRCSKVDRKWKKIILNTDFYVILWRIMKRGSFLE
jgi:hypothetical protein